MTEILVPISFVTVIGAVLGLILGLAGKFLEVPVDELQESLLALLPGVNCGACGYVSCEDYAKKLAAFEESNPKLCIPGRAAVADGIAKLLEESESKE